MKDKEIRNRLERLRDIAESLADVPHSDEFQYSALLGAIQGWFIALEANPPLAEVEGWMLGPFCGKRSLRHGDIYSGRVIGGPVGKDHVPVTATIRKREAV